MLRACHRVLKPGAPLVSFVVAVADGLSPAETVRAVESGPPFVAAGPGHRALLEEAGFVEITVSDVTEEYRVTLDASIRARDAERGALVVLIGAERFEEGQASRRLELAAVDDGLLRRSLLSARRP